MTTSQKLRGHLLIFVTLFTLAILTFEPLIASIDELIAWGFTHTMFAFGLLLGCIYLVLEISAGLCPSESGFSYYLKILPSLFVLNGFIWYCYILVSKVLSESKDDVTYFQAVILAFSVFFLMVKITREIKNIIKNF